MAIIGDVLRQAFMPKHEYQSLREEEKTLHKLLKPAISFVLAVVSISIFISSVISLKIVFPNDNLMRPFCRELRIQPLSINFTTKDTATSIGGDSDILDGAFFLTDQEAVDYYWMVVFIPSAAIFAVSVVYLVAGITVSYTASQRHGCLKVVENKYCYSRRGGVYCLSILNVIFAITFGLLALFLGSTIITLGSSCSLPLFWCYEIASWGLVILHGGTAFFLGRKAAAAVLNESYFTDRDSEIEMLEANPAEVAVDVERRVNEGFKAWMGPSFLSSDEEDEDEDDDELDDNYVEVPSLNITLATTSTRQRV